MAGDSKTPAGSIKTFSCPSCGGTVEIRAVGTSITAVCQSCGSIIDVANDNFRIIEEAAVKIHKSAIPLGARGTLGVEWEVIGYCERSDETEEYWWREYLLFNPYQGFRFLVESDGHWNFVKMLRQNIEGAGTADNVWFDSKEYRIFVRGGAKVQYVMGEFYWRVKIGDMAQVADYVAPPYMLSMEKSDEDIIWSKAVYVDSEEIREAFSLEPASMPYPKGIAPNQPSPVSGKTKGIKATAALFFIALCVMQYIVSSWATNQTVYQRAVQAPAIYKGQLLLSDPIEIPGDAGNVEVWARSPVRNNWVELDISLVNDATQESDDFILPIEYYFGSDSDGPWTEGSQANATIISAVHGGQYHLQVEPDAGAFVQGQPVDIEVRVIRNVPMWENFWVALLLLMGYPLYVMIRSWYFETQRWSTSDYAPAMYRRNS